MNVPKTYFSTELRTGRRFRRKMDRSCHISPGSGDI